MNGSFPVERTELLAPAGDWECVRAAVENGADAVYFGLEKFNARMRADNFTVGDLPRLMRFLHGRGVRGYVTFNVLMFSDEEAEAEAYLRAIIGAGADAVIVQDVGVARLVRRISPDFPIHASTQMSVSSLGGIELARELGCGLVVLARENSLKDIETIQAEQRLRWERDKVPPVALEVFVHGALCVAYSGQCLTSEALGGRSANRGECAQACRLPYDLMADGRQVDLGGRRYLLSPRDLCGVELLPELVRLGVRSLKIEGRLKSADYVASVTRVYREKLDAVLKDSPRRHGGHGDRKRGVLDEGKRYELEMSFSRGFDTGWFEGTDNKQLVHARFGTKRGYFAGRVVGVEGERVFVEAERGRVPLKAGDGVVFDCGNPEAGEEGGRVWRAEALAGNFRGVTSPAVKSGDESPHSISESVRVCLEFGRGSLDFRKIGGGDLVWKTSDPALEREVRATFEGEKVRFRRGVNVSVGGCAGERLSVEFSDGEFCARVFSEMILEEARDGGLSAERAREQLGRLGGTAFRLENFSWNVEGGVMLPVSELNRLRRAAVEELMALREAVRRWTIGTATPSVGGMSMPRNSEGETSVPQLIAVVRSMEQLEAAAACREVADVYCELENARDFKRAVERWRQLVADEGRGIWVAGPRVFRPGEEWILRQLAECGADGFLVRNAEQVRAFKGRRMRGDFSLNVANGVSAEFWIGEVGLERVTASYDLNAEQLEALLAAGCRGDLLEVTLHQRMPLFHMEHCVFCAFLSEGRDFRDCGRPCEKRRVFLRDRVGALLSVRADAGCRNTVFNSRAQSGAEFARRFAELGARNFRVEFLDENAEEVRRTLGLYAGLLRGEIQGADVWRDLRAFSQLGVTRGSVGKSRD